METPCGILGHWEGQGNVEHCIDLIKNMKTDLEYFSLGNMFGLFT
jgi:hypothetical protein